MITVTYQGGDIFNVYLDKKVLVLTGREITQIAEYAVQNNFNVSNNEELTSDNELLTSEIESLQGLLRDAEEENLKLENMLL